MVTDNISKDFRSFLLFHRFFSKTYFQEENLLLATSRANWSPQNKSSCTRAFTINRWSHKVASTLMIHQLSMFLWRWVPAESRLLPLDWNGRSFSDIRACHLKNIRGIVLVSYLRIYEDCKYAKRTDGLTRYHMSRVLWAPTHLTLLWVRRK